MGVAERDGCSCACGDEACCGCVPAEFVRLRYYFGQRLGVMELTDAQAYVVGKQRFHDLRCHGAGVLCGLRADRFVFPMGAPPTDTSTVLRVRRGAALDACGREVIVPDDQCVDVAAWFARRRARADLAAWKSGEVHRLWVAVRYRECPSDPAPAPRDPCGCDAGGCEFGRIREGFELALLTDEEQQGAFAAEVFPPADALLAALGGFEQGDDPPSGTTAGRLASALDRLTAEECPPPKGDLWICLAAFDATVGADELGTPRITDISAPDGAIPGRRSLLSVAALQALVAGLAVSAADEGTVGAGPSLGPIQFDAGPGASSGRFLIPVALVSEGQPAAEIPLAQGTFDPSAVRVHRFTGTAWEDSTPPAAGISYDAANRRVAIAFPVGTLAADTRYRISLVQVPEAPVVDVRMRPLRPTRYTHNVRLVADGGVLKVADSLFPPE